MKVAIRTNYLKAALMFAGKREVRETYNAIHIEASPEHTRLVATDGCVLMVSDEPMLGAAAATITIHRDAIEEAVKAAGKDICCVFEFESGDYKKGDRVVRIQAGQATITTHEMDAKYPEWRRIIPAQVSGEVAQYNPEYLMTLKKAAKAILSIYPGVAMNGVSPGVSMLNKDCLALVMPMRLEPEYSLPEWLSVRQQQAESVGA